MLHIFLYIYMQNKEVINSTFCILDRKLSQYTNEDFICASEKNKCLQGTWLNNISWRRQSLVNTCFKVPLFTFKIPQNTKCYEITLKNCLFIPFINLHIIFLLKFFGVHSALRLAKSMNISVHFLRQLFCILIREIQF